ncbi:MAG: nuclear transport factor 2 family protein, partial [Bacteroidetes bacterium]|nr:nuclear transport factor 2 family protein [Bacteroidota bacterium]
MKLTKKLEAEILKVYNTYWESYSTGDIKTFATTLDKTFEMIGTSETEICHTKEEGIKFVKAQIKELVGKVEMRNRKINVVPVNEMMLVNERCDIYIRTGQEWKFYSKIRISTCMRKTNSGWKVFQQHGSLPDIRVEEGKTLALKKINRENLQLRDAIKRRTIELEEKNRELEIEASLERVRNRAMAMHTSDELKEVAKEMRNQLHLLGQKELETCAIHLWDESSGQFEAWAALRSPDNTGKIIESESTFKIKGIKILEENFQHYRDGKKDYVLINDVAKARQFFEALKPVDPKAFAFLSPTIKNKKPRDISAYWAVADFDGGSLVMVTMNPPEENSRALLRRFADVFGLAYRRFSDLQKAEAQAREAQIEAALEKVRSRTMGMQKSEELKDVINLVYEQLTHLNIHVEHCGFLIDYKTRDDLHIWLADEHLAPSEVIFPWFDCPPNNAIRDAKDKGEDFFFYHLNFKEKNKFYRDLFKLIPGIPEETIAYYLHCPGLAGSGVLLESIGLYIENFSGTVYSAEENAVLMRFGKVF